MQHFAESRLLHGRDRFGDGADSVPAHPEACIVPTCVSPAHEAAVDEQINAGTVPLSTSSARLPAGRAFAASLEPIRHLRMTVGFDTEKAIQLKPARRWNIGQ